MTAVQRRRRPSTMRPRLPTVRPLPCRSVRLRSLILLVVAALTATACSGDGSGEAVIDRAPEPVETTLPATTVPASTTTTEPDPATAKAVLTQGGVVVPVISRAGDGWTVRTPCNATTSLSQTRGRSAGSPVIVLDPGHGGAEPGAVSPAGLAE